MPGTTDFYGWPFPEAGDPIAEGATVLGNAIKGIENSIRVPSDRFTAAEFFTSYPKGISVMYVPGTGTANGWPNNYGNVLTIYSTPSNGWQFWLPYSVGPARARVGIVDTWNSWLTLASPGTPDAMATGQITGTPPSGGGTVALNVTYPSGRFPGTPRVISVINASTKPQECACSAGNLSATGCTIYLYRTGATATSVVWQATYGVEA